MRLIFHIFRKDARRCWREIALTLVLLAWLTRMDSWRSGYVPDSSEGWLNILLPLAWGYLAAAGILQDPVPGERQFWLTLPCRRGAWFGAKALFLLAFLHLPYLLSNTIVLEARDFAPWRYLPRLAEQQLLVLCAVTLPAVALATLARSATQFAALAFGVLGAAAIFSSVSETLGLPLAQSVPWIPIDPPRQALALSLLGLSAFLVAWLQYRSRRTSLSRTVGVAGLAAACALYVLLPAESSAAIESALSPARLAPGPLTVRLAPGERTLDAREIVQSGAVMVAIPVDLPGASALRDVRLEQVSLDLLGPGGVHAKAARYFSPASRASLLASLRETGWEILLLRPALFARLAGTPVTVRGHVRADFHQTGAPVAVPENTRVDLPGFGQCVRSGAGGGLLREDGLRVSCESPGGAVEGRVRLVDTETGREWTGGLGITASQSSYPRNTWLSPIDRREAYFQLTSRDTTRPGWQWQVPQAVVAHARVEVLPHPVVGHAVAGFELTGIRLRDYLVKRDR